MKITLITPIFPPVIGGPATYTWEVSHRLKDHDINIIAFGDDAKKIDVAEVDLVKLREGFWRKLPLIGSVIRQAELVMLVITKALRSDLIYIQGPLVAGFTASFIGQLFAKKMVMKFVGDISWEVAHRKGKTKLNLDEFLESGGGGLLRKLQRAAFHRVDAVVVPSEYLRNILVSYYGLSRDKVHVIYNAVEVPETKKNVNEKVLVTVGRLVPHKNVAGIIEACSILKDYELRVIGEGPEGTSLRELARSLGANVVFLGSQPRAATLSEIANARAFILNSNYEGLPHTVVEAMYLRTPVVATDILGTNEIATDETSTPAPPNNPEGLAEKIKEALETDKTEAAYSWASSRFNWEQNISQLESLFERLCQK